MHASRDTDRPRRTAAGDENPALAADPRR
jgi:hypothetical protein